MIQLKQYRILIGVLIFSLVTLACGITFNPTREAGSMPPAAAEIDVTPANSLQPVALNLLQPTQVSQPLVITSEEQILIDLYKKTNPSVVNIITYISRGNSIGSTGQGSGFVFDASGHIVTNSHVVHGADQIEVIFSDGLSEQAQIVGLDLHSDLAVIKVEDYPEGVQPLHLGTMEELAVGQTAVALGNPFGLGGTLTRGIISALGRSIPALTYFSIPQAIQTDAAINPGNSGGPLLNLAGDVIGVNAQIETGGESRSNSGVGFAIPVSILARVVPALIQDGEFTWSWLGVSGGNLTSPVKQAMDLSVEKGAYISTILDDGPAQKAGLRGSSDYAMINQRRVEVGGDVIVGIDGTAVNTFEDLLIYIALNTQPGQAVKLTVIRDGEPMEISLTLEPRPNETVEFSVP